MCLHARTNALFCIQNNESPHPALTLPKKPGQRCTGTSSSSFSSLHLGVPFTQHGRSLKTKSFMNGHRFKTETTVPAAHCEIGSERLESFLSHSRSPCRPDSGAPPGKLEQQACRKRASSHARHFPPNHWFRRGVVLRHLGLPIRFQRFLVTPRAGCARATSAPMEFDAAGSGLQRGSRLPSKCSISATQAGGMLHEPASKVGLHTFGSAPNPGEASSRSGKPAGTRTNSSAASAQREAPNRRLVDLNYIPPFEAPDVHFEQSFNLPSSTI